MEQLWQSYNLGSWVDPFLLISVAIFIVIATSLFFLIIIRRSERIERRKRYNEYEVIIEKIFMSVIFLDRNYAAIKQDTEFTEIVKMKNFRKQMLKAIISLHQNYEGRYAQKLEVFYFESGLIKMSLASLKSKKWEVVCNGVQEIAEMKVTKAFPAIVKLSKTKNRILKITAIKACTKLNGNKGITHLKDHKDPIDLWTQVNIIAAFKRKYTEDNEDIEVLLTSGNSSVISLGLKIIQTLELARKLPFVTQLIEQTSNEIIRLEAQGVLYSLTEKNISA